MEGVLINTTFLRDVRLDDPPKLGKRVSVIGAEAVCCLEEVYPDRRDEIGRGVRARLDSAAGNLATDYIKAQ